MPSQQYIHGQRQQIQDRPCTCYLGEQIAGRSIYTCPRTETVFQKAISRYAVLTPVKRHKVTSRKIRGDRNRKTEYKCIPISRKGLSRISQITDTADIRGENGHPHHPAGQTSSGRSELLGGTFLLKERTTEGHDSAGKQQKDDYINDLDETPLVRDLLPEATDSGLKKALYELFGIERMLDKHIILLSSGELRKFQLTKTLLSNPRVLIMDNPFIGLDAKTRDLLHTLLGELTKVTHLQVILILSKSDDIPAFITHVIPVEDRVCGKKMTLQEYLAVRKSIPERMLSEEKEARILNLPYGGDLYHTEHVVDLNKVSIRYGERTILKDLDWTVKCGEKWALSGENGSGKSTLLSLVCADNPQSYACDITLFGRKRGSGESIWEIKKHIGYVSPEMHRAYLKNLPAIDIVASGLHDSVGLYKRPRPEQMAACEWWMDIFGIANLKDRNFLQLSSGEQRLVLLARAFVKDPELLILDEPLHGLDLYNRRLVKDVIETFCRRKDKTMIMVTHYQEELPACITNSLFLKRN